jgi:hypothetical protein
VTDCQEWYLYDFDANLPKEDQEYFGQNDGTPMWNPKGSGLLSQQNNLYRPCEYLDRSAPYYLNKNTDLGLRNESIN